MKEVLIYTTNHCPYCQAAKRLLTSKKVAYKEIDVTDNDEERERLVKKSGGRETVPQIFVDGNCIGGYDDLVRFYEKGGTI